MCEFYEMNFNSLTYEDYETEVRDLYSSLQEFYMEFLDAYKELCVALDEISLYHMNQLDLDTFIIAREKAKYLTQKICVFSIQERDIYYSNSELLPYLEEHIKRAFKLKGVLDTFTFSPMDPEIYDDFRTIKDNYPIIRMIRALKFYGEYYNEFHSRMEITKLQLTEDEIITSIPYDYSDIECTQTMIQLKDTFSETFDVHLCNKCKCLFSFMNPRMEYIFINIDFADPFIHLYEVGNEEEKLRRRKEITSKAIHALIAVEHNKVINHRKGGSLICDEPKLGNVKKLNEYLKNKDDLYLLYAFLVQSYGYLPLETVEDLDHLLTEMCKLEDEQYKDIKLSEKVVNYFFRRDAYNNLFDIERKRENEE